MNFITKRAVSKAKYLIRNGVDPKDAIEISISRYMINPKIDIKKLIEEVKKEIKQEFYYEDNEIWDFIHIK